MPVQPYEIVVIFDVTLEEASVEAVIGRCTELIESLGGTVNQADRWGRRRFAYELAHRSEGYYVLLEVTTDPSSVDDVNRFLRLADEVIRHKIVRVPEHRAGRTVPGPDEDPVVSEARPGASRGKRENERKSEHHGQFRHHRREPHP
ncbi:MAG: 30S ribosomal protein S6 [Acidimicrobiales bacterium]